MSAAICSICEAPWVPQCADHPVVTTGPFTPQPSVTPEQAARYGAARHRRELAASHRGKAERGTLTFEADGKARNRELDAASPGRLRKALERSGGRNPYAEPAS